jgi:hypothetical protein
LRPPDLHAQATGLTVEDLRNTTYPSDFTARKSAPLTDGRYEEPPNVSVAFQEGAVGPDFAVAILASSGGASGVFYTAHVVTATAGAPYAGPQEVLGDRIQLQSLAIEGDRVFIGMVAHAPTDPQCCPTRAVTRQYRRTGDLLTLIEERPGFQPPSTGSAGLLPRHDRSLDWAWLAAGSLLAIGVRLVTRRHPQAASNA